MVCEDDHEGACEKGYIQDANAAYGKGRRDGKPRTSMDSYGQKPEIQVYFGKLKKLFFKAKDAVFAAKKQAQKKIVGNSVTVARLTLDQLVQVRILVPQMFHQSN